MLKIKITKQFKKDFKKYIHKDLTQLNMIIKILSREQTLPAEYHDHQLSGKLKSTRDCHIEPDFILLYEKKNNELRLIRLGTHSDLFK
jgi:mRNA interferase YafQ